MRSLSPRPRRGPAALAIPLLSLLAAGCDGVRHKAAPAPPADLSGVWNTGVTVTTGTCDSLYVPSVAGRILTVRQEDGAILAQANEGDSVTCGPALSCGSGSLQDDLLFLSLLGSAAYDPSCTLHFEEEISGVVEQVDAVLNGDAAPASLDPLQRIRGAVTLEVTAAGVCPIPTPCRFEGDFSAAPRGVCPPGMLCPAVIVCAPPWECAVPL